MKCSIPIERYIFSESFAFQPKKKSQIGYELLKFIPVISLALEAKALMHCLKKRHTYDKSDRYIFDVRFSYQSITMHVANALGLAILILPLRISATSMRNHDISKQKKCDNPHRLSDENLKICNMINSDPSIHFQGLLNICPEQEDFCHRMAYRDHIQHPEYLLPSLYDDPFEKKSDAEIKKTLHEYRERYAYEEKVKIKMDIKKRGKNNGI